MRFALQAEPEETFRATQAASDIVQRDSKLSWALTIPLVILMWGAMHFAPKFWIRITIGGFILMAVMLLAVMLEGRWRMRRMVFNDPGARVLIDIDVREDGMTVSIPQRRAESSWEGIHKVVETPEFFFFFYTPVSAQHLPKRIVGAADAELRDLIRRRSPDRGANLKG